MLTEIQIDNMLHCLGISYTRGNDKVLPNKRYSPYPTSYRNYYQTSDNESWNDLVQKELAIKTKNGLDLIYYFVTDKGKDHLKEIGYKWHEDR